MPAGSWIQPVESVDRYAAVTAPIVAAGDVTGAVCMLLPESVAIPSESDVKLCQVAAAFLAGGPAGFAVEKWTLGEAAFDAQWGMFRVKLQAHCRGWLVARTQESGEIVGFAVKGEVVL